MPAIKAYKGFNRDMTCHGFQFREGETHELPEGQEAKLCQSGFHACENPVDCLRYYGAGTSVYREVELDATDERHEDDSKRVGSKIKIGAVLDVAKICKLAFEYVKKRCTNSNNAESGAYGAASAGYREAASAGESGAASAGSYGAASAGYRGAASAGCRGAASAGEYGAASAGEYGAASAGEYGAAVSRGSVSVDKDGIACARGNNVKARGGQGAVLVLCEEKSESYGIRAWRAAVVDGEVIKPDTWYQLNDDGEFVECQEGANDGDDD